MALTHSHPRLQTRRATVIALVAVTLAVGTMLVSWLLAAQLRQTVPGPSAEMLRPSLVADRAEWYATDGPIVSDYPDAIDRILISPRVDGGSAAYSDAIARHLASQPSARPVGVIPDRIEQQMGASRPETPPVLVPDRLEQIGTP